MTSFLYRVFALLFIVGKLFPQKKNRIAMLAIHSESSDGALSNVAHEAKKKGFESVFITPRKSGFASKLYFLLVSPFQLARAKYIFLNDNFMPMAYLNFRKNVTVTQLWHGDGAFKKFGMMIDVDKNARIREKHGNEKLDYVVCSSKNVVDIYAQAFNVPKGKVLPLGSARADYLLKEHDVGTLRSELEKQYPELAKKKLVLYAPTFRDDLDKNERVYTSFHAKALAQALGSNWAILTRFHPAYKHLHKPMQGGLDVTNHESVSRLVLLCDVLVTDYSSIVMDFALLNKPIYFFSFDLADYECMRDFCFDYEPYVPGPISSDMPKLIRDMTQDEYNFKKLEEFRNFNYDYVDDRSSKRIVDAILQ